MYFLFEFDRIIYLSFRTILRIFLGKKKRNKFLNSKKIIFSNFLFGNPVFEIRGIKTRLRCNTDDYDIMRDDHEDFLIPYLKLFEGEFFVDIGANIGRYTLLQSKLFNKNKIRIISIEPDPDTFKALKYNVLKLNKLQNVILVNKAVFSTKKQISFYQVKGLSDFNSIYRTYGKKIPVQGDTLDGILKENKIEKVDVIKIDVEGAEIEALKGSNLALDQARKVIVEVHADDVNDYGGFDVVKKILEDKNFSVEKIGTKLIFAIGTKLWLFYKKEKINRWYIPYINNNIILTKKSRSAFRKFFYFRLGYTTYFAMFVGVINIMTTTYFLAIDKIPSLLNIFPTFEIYVVTLVVTGIPIVTLAGYIHLKRIGTFAAEQNVSVEMNPYNYKPLPGYHTESIIPAYHEIVKLMIKKINNEKLTDIEIKKLISLEKDLIKLIDGGYVGNPPKGVF